MRREAGQKLLDLTACQIVITSSHIQIDQPEHGEISGKTLRISFPDAIERLLVEGSVDQFFDMSADLSRLILLAECDFIKPSLNRAGRLLLLKVKFTAQMHGFTLSGVVL